jgi:hypothetical protein
MKYFLQLLLIFTSKNICWIQVSLPVKEEMVLTLVKETVFFFVMDLALWGISLFL